MNKPSMRNKTIMGLALAALVLFCLYYGGPALFALAAIGGGGMMYEYYELLRRKGVKPLTYFGILAGVSFIVIAYWSMETGRMKQSPAVFGTVVTFYVLVILIMQFVQILQGRQRYLIVDLATTVFASIFIGGFMSLLFLLLGFGLDQYPDSLVQSRMPMFLAMWGSWGADVGAYFVGSFLGRTKIFPEISPNKTLEGFIGGVSICAVGMGLLGLTIDIPLFHGIVLGLLAGAAGQIGDLSESAFKREVGIKDSGGIFGSHGGFLDRADSLMFSVPVVYYYFVWFCPWTQ